MDHHSQAPILVASGPRGRGKTTWLRAAVADPAPRLLCIDPLGEYGGSQVWTAAQVLAWHDRGGPQTPRWRITLRSCDVAECDAVIAASWTWGNCTVLIEEADRFKVASPTARDATPGVWALSQYGRHAGVTMAAATRRPASLPRCITANASIACVWYTYEPRDMAYWREFLPGEAAAALPHLEGHSRVQADLWAGTHEVTDRLP